MSSRSSVGRAPAGDREIMGSIFVGDSELFFVPRLCPDVDQFNVMAYYNFQGPAGSTGMTGSPGTKGEMVRNCRCVAHVFAKLTFVFSVV